MSLFPNLDKNIFSNMTINLVTYSHMPLMQLYIIENKLKKFFLQVNPNKFVLTKHKCEKGIKDNYFDNLFGIQWIKNEICTDNNFNNIYQVFSLFYDWTKINIHNGDCMAVVIYQD